MAEEQAKTLADKEKEKRQALVEEMYGYTPEEQMSPEQKDEFSELIKSYAEHRKGKQKQPLKNILGR
jgi:hypothetical protein